eukprot:7678375-Lingulodinium_polyedra.AAC.1
MLAPVARLVSLLPSTPSTPRGPGCEASPTLFPSSPHCPQQHCTTPPPSSVERIAAGVGAGASRAAAPPCT